MRVKSGDGTYRFTYPKKGLLGNKNVDKLIGGDRTMIEELGGAEVWIVEESDEIYLALKFCPELIDKTAHENKIWGDLVESQIRYKFNRHM